MMLVFMATPAIPRAEPIPHSRDWDDKYGGERCRIMQMVSRPMEIAIERRALESRDSQGA